jgi:GWxTD domain-containing protein
MFVLLRAVAGALVSTWGPPVPCMAEVLPQMDAVTTRADSVALAERYLTDTGTEKGCAELRAGYLLAMTSTPAESEWRNRQRATELLESALRSHEDEPRLYLATAKLLYNRQSRTDALRMLDRAYARREGATPLRPREVALIFYLRGLIHQDFWRDWRSYGQLKATAAGAWRCSRSEEASQDNFTSSSNDNSWLIPVNQLCPDRFTENMERFFDSRTNLNADALVNMEAAFREALATDSLLLPAAEALLGEWVYLADWAKAEPLVRSLYARMPEDYHVYLYLGLVLHRTGRDSLAGPEFAKAFRYMPDSIAASMGDITPLLLPAQLEWFQARDSVDQQFFRNAFWNSLDPLYLTTVNERKLEHYARFVAADLMFGSRAIQEPGWKSFAGQVWIRYGRPRHMWELQEPAGRVVFWDYGTGPDVTFERGLNSHSYRPTDEAYQYANALARTSPQTYTPEGLIDTTLSLPVQIVRTLGAGMKPQLLIYGEWPDSASAEATAGLTLLDLQYQPVAQWRGRKPNRPGLSAELNGMAGGTYSLTLEVWDRPTRHLYRARDTVTTLAVDDSSFVVSDLLLASRVSSRRGDDATSRKDLDLEPLYGSAIRAGQSVGLAWELYRLGGERDGRLRYRVSLEVRGTGEQPILTRILQGVGIKGPRRPESRVEYETTRPLVEGRAVEWLELSSTFAPGEYRIVLRLTDSNTGHEVMRERTLRVLPK